MDLVSAVVVTYNSADTVIETLDSIYNQTYPRIELIVSDDYSTDNTREIVRDWCKTHRQRFERVLIRNPKKNLGVTQNCNHAIAQANGKWIAEMAGDDILLDECIKEKIEYALNNNCEMVMSRIEPFGCEGKNINNIRARCKRAYRMLGESVEEQYDKVIEVCLVFGPMGGFFQKDFFEKWGKYDESYPSIEDYPFYFKLITNGYQMPFLDKTLVKYRVNDDSLSQSNEYVLNGLTRSSMKFFYKKRLWHLLRNKKFKVAWQQHKYYRGLK